MSRLGISICLLALSSIQANFVGFAQENNDSTIVDYIQEDSHNNVIIELPGALKERLNPESTDKPVEHHGSGVQKMLGYRIQIFSDNNHKTAKNEAQIKERNIVSRFPSLPSYLSYKAPAWRLRVGDFKTSEDAREMMLQIKKAFPGYSREIIIVRDMINVY